MVTPAAARLAGGLYSDTEFDLSRVRPLLGRAVELGRSCVHPSWRSGGVVLALWAALGEFMLANDLDTMVGCASVSVRDGGHTAASLWARLSRTHLAPEEWQVTPRVPLPVDALRQDLDVDAPALIKGYLRCGAKVLGVIDGEARGPKIRVFKKKRRKGMRRTKGHRAFYTRVRITDIVA